MPTPTLNLPPSPYSVYPLEALDGVLAYIALDGETVAYCFGPDERQAAEAVAARLTRSAARSGEGARPEWASSEE